MEEKQNEIVVERTEDYIPVSVIEMIIAELYQALQDTSLIEQERKGIEAGEAYLTMLIIYWCESLTEDIRQFCFLKQMLQGKLERRVGEE